MIELLRVQNFRCLESVTLDFAGRPSALIIGKNGVGKSTVRQSLALLQGICRGSSRVGKLIAASDFTQHRTDHPMRFDIEATLEKRRFRYTVSFDWPPHFREARIVEESLSVDGAAVFVRHLGQIQLADGTVFGLDEHIFALPVINERPPERAIQDIKAFFASMILIAPIPGNMTGYSESPSLELEHDAANYASCLRALLGQKPAAYSAFESYVRAVIPDFSSIENVERGENGTQLMVKFEQGGSRRSLSVEFKALSDGEKCFFLSAYIVATNTVGSPVVCVWDEPDNHLSLSELGQFIMGLRKMVLPHFA
jgi:energy-coupling factor transporter ATP-binding protein EcfA2